MSLEKSMWQALQPLPLQIPTLSQGLPSCQYGHKTVSAFAVLQTDVNYEALQRARALDLLHVAKVLDCRPFRHEGELYFAILEEGHVKTLEYEVKCREKVPFEAEELEAVLRTLQETLYRLLEEGLLYSISAQLVRICPAQVYKLGAMWTCSFAAGPADVQSAIRDFQTLCRDLISRFPAAQSPVLEAILENFPLIASFEGEKGLLERETVPMQRRADPAPSENGATVDRNMKSNRTGSFPTHKSCKCEIT